MSVDRTISTYSNMVINRSRDKVLQALDQPQGNRVICSLEYIHFHEFVIYMLDILMNIRGWKGILISIDKPANYILRLMKDRNLNLDRIHIIDIMTALTSETPNFPPCVVPLRSPFCTDLDKDLLDVLGGNMAKEVGIDLTKTHFLIFDNIAVLDHYIELITLKRIFIKLEGFLKGYPMLKNILIIDKKRQLRVYESFEGWADHEVSLD